MVQGMKCDTLKMMFKTAVDQGIISHVQGNCVQEFE
jgi:hypothetical protein